MNFSLDSVCLSALRSHDPPCVAGVWSRDHHHGQHDLLRLWRRQPTQPELPVRHTVTHRTVIDSIKKNDDDGMKMLVMMMMMMVKKYSMKCLGVYSDVSQMVTGVGKIQ